MQILALNKRENKWLKQYLVFNKLVLNTSAASSINSRVDTHLCKLRDTRCVHLIWASKTHLQHVPFLLAQFTFSHCKSYHLFFVATRAPLRAFFLLHHSTRIPLPSFWKVPRGGGGQRIRARRVGCEQNVLRLDIIPPLLPSHRQVNICNSQPPTPPHLFLTV